MFLANCTSCGRRELRSLGGIRAHTNTVHGWQLQFQCRSCGAEVVEPGRRTPLSAPQQAVLAAGNPDTQKPRYPIVAGRRHIR